MSAGEQLPFLAHPEGWLPKEKPRTRLLLTGDVWHCPVLTSQDSSVVVPPPPPPPLDHNHMPTRPVANLPECLEMSRSSLRGPFLGRCPL